MDAEGEALHDVVDEVDRALLVVALVDAQRTDPGRVVDRRELVTLAQAPVVAPELQELQFDLDVVAGDLLLVAQAHDRARAAVGRQAGEADALEHAVDPVARDRDAVVALQVPGDAHRAEVVGAAQVDDLFFDLGWGAQGHVHGAGLLVD